MANLEELLIRIDASTEGLRRELRRADASVKQTTGIIEAQGKKIERAFGGAAKAAVALGTALAIRSLKNLAADAVQTSMRFDALAASMLAASRNSDEAARNMQFLRSEADRLGLVTLDAGKAFARLTAAAKGTALEGDGVRQIFTAISEAATVLRFNTEDTEGAIRALEQMVSKGKVSMEELRLQLGDRLPGALQIAARAMDTNVDALSKMIADGKVYSEDFLPKFAKAIRESFGKGVADASQSAQANINRLTDSFNDFESALGKAITQSDAYKDTVSGLTSLFDSLAKVINLTTGNLENFTNQQLTDTLNNTIANISRTQEQINRLSSGGGFFASSADRQAAIKKETEFLKEYKDRYSELFELLANRAAPNKAGKPANDNKPPVGGIGKPEIDKIAEYRKELALTVEQTERLVAANMESEEAYKALKRQIDAENEARSRGLKIGTKEYEDTVRLIKKREEMEETIERTTKAREEAIRKAEEEQKAYAEALSAPWEHAFENVQDALAEMLADGKYNFEALSSIAKKLAAEVAAAWIIRPALAQFVGPGGFGSITGVGGATGAAGGGGGSQLSNLMSLGNSLFGGTGGGIGGSIISQFDDIASGIFGTASSTAVGPFLPGTGTASSILGSTFGGSYGGAIASLLGLGSGNFAIDTGTSLAGAALGNLIAPGVGGIIGSFAGTALGGLFGGKSRPHPAASVGVSGFTSSGGLLGTDLQAKHLSTEDAKRFAESLGTVTAAMAAVSGINFSAFKAPEGGTAFQAGVNDGQGFFTFGSHKTDLGNKRVSVTFDPQDENDLNRAMGDLAKLFVMRAQDIGEEVNQTLISVLDNIKTEGRTAEEVIADIAFATAYDTLGQFPQQLSEVAQAVQELRKQFNEAAETSERLGLAVEKVRQYEQVRMTQLLGGYTQGIAQAILGATNPAALQTMSENSRYAEQLRDLKLLNATEKEFQQAELLHQINLALIQEQNSDAQQEALETERERLNVANDLARRFASVSNSFESILHDLTLGQYSPLDPVSRLSALRNEVQSLGAQAQLGNADAAEELAKLLPEFVALSGQVNGFNTAFEADRQIAESLARATLSTAERQVQLQTSIANAAQAQINTLQSGFASLEAALARFGSNLTVKDITNAAQGLTGLTDGQAWATQWARSQGYLGQNETATGGLLAGRLDATGGDAWNDFNAAKSAAGFAAGGLVAGISGFDSIPARLTDGEFVMRRTAVNNIGAANLAAMNNGAGGTMADVVKAIGRLSQISAATGEITAQQLSAMRASLNTLERNARLVASA